MGLVFSFLTFSAHPKEYIKLQIQSVDYWKTIPATHDLADPPKEYGEGVLFKMTNLEDNSIKHHSQGLNYVGRHQI